MIEFVYFGQIRQFKRWQKSCNELSQVNIEDLKKHAELEAEKKKLEAENKIKDEMAELMSKEISLKITKSVRSKILGFYSQSRGSKYFYLS